MIYHWYTWHCEKCHFRVKGTCRRFPPQLVIPSFRCTTQLIASKYPKLASNQSACAEFKYDCDNKR